LRNAALSGDAELARAAEKLFPEEPGLGARDSGLDEAER
jgi:hypothetical protein